MVITQYPDDLSASVNAESTQDANGNWVQGSSGSALTSKCRYEANDGSGYVVGENGNRIDFSAVVYLPVTAPLIKTGSVVQITIKRTGEADQVISDSVKRFSRGQLNARIWL
jgi:hypothetical protein